MHGLPVSWGLVVATTYNQSPRGGSIAWSPCNRFIAVNKDEAVEILDAVTLNRLSTFEYPRDHQGRCHWLCFSPDGRFLTRLADKTLASWDLQTGGPLGTIFQELEAARRVHPPAFSADGEMVAFAFESKPHDTVITILHILSGTRKRPYRISGGRPAEPIWTHGEHLRFATVKPGSITIWETPFTLTHEPAEIGSLPAPDKMDKGKDFLFLPALSQLAFTANHTLFAWDAKASKYLLEFPIPSIEMSSFSSGGHFLACRTRSREVFVWEVSPAGYELHQKLTLPGGNTLTKPHLSSNGESIIASFTPVIHLWHTKDQVLSSVPPLRTFEDRFSLEFSSDGEMAVFVRRRREVVTIFDLRSGDPLLIITTGMEVLCLGITGSSVVVTDGKKMITWNLPAGGCPFLARADIDDSVRTTMLDSREEQMGAVSMSPDHSYLAIEVFAESVQSYLDIYDVPTGRHLVRSELAGWSMPRFTPDGRKVGNVFGRTPVWWEIVEDGESGATKLDHPEPFQCPPEVIPWLSADGYEVKDDYEWALGPTGKRLLWLPHSWRSRGRFRTWGGRFLALLDGGLPEIVILEFIE